jgi:hypothetical protein
MSAALLELTSARWHEALDHLNHDVYHLPGYAEVDSCCGGGEPLAFSWRHGHRELLVPLIARPIPGGDGVDLFSPYGYGGPAATAGMDAAGWRQACAALVETLASHGAVACFVRLHPLMANGLSAMSDQGVVLHHGDTVTIDLTRPADELRDQIRQNHRRDLRALRRVGVQVLADEHWDHLDDFIEIYHQTMRRVDADPYYFFDHRYFELLRSRLAGHVHLMLAVHDGTVIAGGIFTESGGITGYHLGGTRDGHLARSPFKLVLDEAREWAQRRGNTQLHLGGGVGGGGGALLRFKLGFSDQRRPFHTWRIVLDEPRYRELCHELRPGTDPADRCGFFPAYRAPLAQATPNPAATTISTTGPTR